LFAAVKNGHTDVVKYLIREKHADATITNSKQETVLHLAMPKYTVFEELKFGKAFTSIYISQCIQLSLVIA